MYKSNGIINYSNKSGFYRLTVEIDQELANYYFSLIPKYIWVNRPRYKAHITVVRPEKETPIFLEFWKKYQGEKVEFLYDPNIQCGREYFWLNILCKRLEEIRAELGLSIRSQYTQPPVGFSKYFHCTIANSKNIS